MEEFEIIDEYEGDLICILVIPKGGKSYVVIPEVRLENEKNINKLVGE